MLLGIWMQLLEWLEELAGRMLNYPPDLAGPSSWSLLGVRGIASNFLGIDLGMSLLHGLGFSFLLLLLSLALKGERRGAIAAWLPHGQSLTLRANTFQGNKITGAHTASWARRNS